MNRTSEDRVEALLRQMTVEEKIGQLSLIQSDEGRISNDLRQRIRGGRIGGVLNETDPEVAREIQRIAREESRLGIPLLIGRDVIHGFRTVFPIPLGQAASWDLDLVERCARASGREAAASGVNWTFSPMLDIGRDPRWGRIAETFGEDPWLIGEMGAAMIRGFQGDDLSSPEALATSAKHFVGYGASEGGRDYAATFIPETELRNVHLPPFERAVEAGTPTVMPSFSDLNGIPATGNEWLLTDVLREEWGFDGLVVSDWNAVQELSVHGLTDGDREAARVASGAGIDMEMASQTFAEHLRSILDSGELPLSRLDAMVRAILRVKQRLGLLADTSPEALPPAPEPDLDLAREAAAACTVLLKNHDSILPLAPEALNSIAVIGPLADDPYEQLGTWIFDGDPALSQTPLSAIREEVGDAVRVEYERGLETSRSESRERFEAAMVLARGADVAVLVLGEESILSGEAHCRADIRLPGAQEALVRAVAETGTPVVLIVMAGRPLALQAVVPHVDALLFAWHPGTMAGPGLSDVVFGRVAPSARLPVTFPRVSGQVPLYYAHRNTGRPPTPESVVSIDEIEPRAAQTSVGNTSFYLDAGDSPLFPFGFGLTYSDFAYENVRVSTESLRTGDSLTVSVDLANQGPVEAVETVQLYVRDVVGSITRPVRELKAFQRVLLASGETTTVSFDLTTDDLSFVDRHNQRVTEPGAFHVWVGGDATADQMATFRVEDGS